MPTGETYRFFSAIVIGQEEGLEGFNTEEFDSEEAQTYLYEILNSLVRDGGQNAENFSYFGRKGGSTAWIFTQAGFGTNRTSGVQAEYAVFFDGSPDDQDRLEGMFNDFLINIFFEPSYLQKLAEAFGS